MLDVIKNCYLLVNTIHRNLEESPVADTHTHTHVEPSNGFPPTVDRWHGCSEVSITRSKRIHGQKIVEVNICILKDTKLKQKTSIDAQYRHNYIYM